jgi:uncharacterized peroxidase-related enzyme
VTFVEGVPEEGAPEPVARMYEGAREQMGYVPNFVELFTLRPDVFGAWQQLNGAVKKRDVRRYELATLAAARALRSSYCSLAHGKVLAEDFYDAETVAAFPEGLDEADRAVMDFAEKVVRDATSITGEDVGRLKALGLSDVDVLDVALAAAARCFFSKTLDALGAEPDREYRDVLPAPLIERLTVGRPIEADRT